MYVYIHKYYNVKGLINIQPRNPKTHTKLKEELISDSNIGDSIETDQLMTYSKVIYLTFFYKIDKTFYINVENTTMDVNYCMKDYKTSYVYSRERSVTWFTTVYTL